MLRWTILLPTHSAASTVGLAIESALAQTDRDFELLVVGDGCDEATRAVILGFTDPRIRFFDYAKDAGFGYANRRAALAQSDGEYIALLSDDDLWAPGHLESLTPLLDGGNSFAYSRPLWCVPTGHLVPVPFDLTDPVVLERFAELNHIPSVCFVITRGAMDAAGGWPVDVTEAADWTLWRRILALPDARVGYRSEPSTIHFRARRRNFDHPAVAAILGIDRIDEWWPAAARVDETTHDTLQGAVAAGSTETWWSEVAAAAVTIDAHLAFVAVDGSVKRERHIEMLSTQLSLAQTEVSALRSSHSWRLTRPLRALRGRRVQDES